MKTKALSKLYLISYNVYPEHIRHAAVAAVVSTCLFGAMASRGAVMVFSAPADSANRCSRFI